MQVIVLSETVKIGIVAMNDTTSNYCYLKFCQDSRALKMIKKSVEKIQLYDLSWISKHQ